MRKKFIQLYLTIIFSLAWRFAFTQNKPNGATNPATATAEKMPVPYNSDIKVNFVRTYIPNKPVTDPATVTMASPVTEVMVTTAYADAMGRDIQTVRKGASPTQKDMVGFRIYDAFNREVRQFLPYTSPTANGLFKQNAFSEDSVFNRSAFPGEQVYYGNTVYDNSPLNKVMKITAPGNSWAGGGRGIATTERANTAADSVRKWVTQDATVEGIPASAAFYAANQLLVQESLDEANVRILKYIDQRGRIILLKKQVLTAPASGHYGWLCTYYIYDELNNLRYIIPPSAVDIIRLNNWSLADADLRRNLCFRYGYDSQKRTVVRGLPGAGLEEIVYDTRNRPVFNRDSSLKVQNKWSVAFYDGLDRPVMSALYNSNAARESLQSTMDQVVGSAQNISYIVPGTADLVIANYDMRSGYEATNSIVFEPGFESTVNAEFTAEINPAANGGVISLTAINPLPNISTADLTPLTYSFYDNYNFSGALPAETADFNKPLASTGSFSESIAKSGITRGVLTGNRQRIIGTDEWLTTTNYYNSKGRLIQTISDNITHGKSIETSLYDFSGKLLSTYQQQSNLRSGVTPKSTLLTMMDYDHAGRLIRVRKRLNDNAQLERTVAENIYNELGQLKKRLLGVQPGGNVMDSLVYEYNIRGWLKGVNRAYVNTAAGAVNKFGEELNYDFGFNVPQFNGNIAGIKWRGWNDKTSRAYGYDYDKANRLIRADFTQQNTVGATWTSDKADFSVSGLAYDHNGNITSMIQKGLKGTTSSIVDQLTYRYISNSNKLQGVVDAVNDANSALGDFKEINGNSANDYSYDGNGNQTSDLNRGIARITYNFLNLPERIFLTGKGVIQFTYDAAGNKLKKTVTDSTSTPVNVNTVYYMNGFVYQNDSLQFLPHEEGRVRAVYHADSPVGYVYDYFIKDHLGSVRMVLTEQTDFSIYTATMETENAAKESALFSNVEESRTVKPVGYPADRLTNQNQYVAKLNADNGGKKIGPSLVLRVMAGDTIQIGARAFYKSTGSNQNQSVVSTEQMLTSLLQVLGRNAAGEGAHGVARTAPFSRFAGNFNASDYQRLKEKSPDKSNSNSPKAYLNFVLFDDQFNLVEDNSGVRQVKAEPDQLQTLGVDKMPISRSGFLYVYTSNETAQDVFFDNVTLGVTSGPVLEETHYYPFGLEMAGISYSAPLKLKNDYRYNGGAELLTDFDIRSYSTFYRPYDPQIGRFTGVDIAAAELHAFSPYTYAFNNPVLFNDPLGDKAPPLYDIISTLSNGGSGNGGSWSSSTGFSFYSSSSEAFTAGASQMNEGGAWGSYGFANSYESAASSYNAAKDVLVTKNFVPPSMIFLRGVTVRKYDELSYRAAGVEMIREMEMKYTLPSLPFYAGTGMSIAEEAMFSKKLNTWMGKDFRIRSQNWGGNGMTGGKFKYASNTANKIKWLGRGLGVYSAYTTFEQFQNGEITDAQLIVEESSNVYSTLGGVYGASWGVGWEIGRVIAGNHWYRQNVRPYIQDMLGVKRDEYPRMPDCIMCPK